MRKLLVVLLVIVGLVAAACDPADEAAPPRDDDDDHVDLDLSGIELIGLVTEDSCGPLLDWFKKEASAYADQFLGFGRDVYAYAAPESLDDSATARATAGAEESQASAPATSAPVAGTDYSTTNVQEEGVDEPDIVKTDGRRLVALAGGHLRVVDLSGERPRLVASLPVVGAHDLLLSGDRVVVIGSEATVYPTDAVRPMPAPGVASDVAIAPVPGGYYEPKVTITVVDISDPATPKVSDTQELDGSFVAARMTDGVVRVVLRWSPTSLLQRSMPMGGAPASEEDVKAQLRAVIDQSVIEDWVPDYVPCEQVHHPKGFTGPEMVTVVSIDPADPRPGNGASVAGAGETVYASLGRLYVTSNNWGGPLAERAGPSTEIHSFDISDKVTTRYVGSGSVDGQLLNQFSLSEHEGVLRVATTTADGTTGETSSQVVALRQDGAELKQIGAVGGLGKTERIYAVRFMGDLGYVVTFRQMDPLYVLDLSEPEQPVLKGELKIPGYSAYLHPIGDGRLLGVGQDATDQGRRLGAQVSLFDVSDPSNPKQLAKHDLGAYSSSAEYDHHAFLYWAKSKLAVLPVDGFMTGDGASVRQAYRPAAIGVTVDGDALREQGRVEHPTQMPITRSLVVGESLLTLSEVGLMASDLDSLGGGVWMAF